ncbi:hypothetical protein R1sor_022990 [Riccia sorocarpa]|uniref:Uncharacterized protein n=1 Tax=Riccia sorocarpa TaxID=122646 RepID=A0ABD3GQL5_9MARC
MTSKYTSKEQRSRSIPTTATWTNVQAGQRGSQQRPWVSPPQEPQDRGKSEGPRSNNHEGIKDSERGSEKSDAVDRTSHTLPGAQTDPPTRFQAASGSPHTSMSCKSIKWGHLGEEEIQNLENDVNLSEKDETQNNIEMEELKWRRDVTEEVIDAFMRLPTRTGELKDEEVEVCHIFDFDALVRIQTEKRRWEDCGVIFCTIDMSPSWDTFVQWIYQEFENKAAVQIQHVRILVRSFGIQFDTLPDACFNFQERGHYACTCHKAAAAKPAKGKSQAQEAEEDDFIPGVGAFQAILVGGAGTPHGAKGETAGTRKAVGGDSSEPRYSMLGGLPKNGARSPRSAAARGEHNQTTAAKK